MGSGESERGTRNGGIDESWEGRLVLCCGSDAEARERERWMQLRFVCGGSDFAIVTVGVETIEMAGWVWMLRARVAAGYAGGQGHAFTVGWGEQKCLAGGKGDTQQRCGACGTSTSREWRKDGCNGAVVTSLVLDVLHCMHEQYERPVSLASTRRRQQTSAWDRQEGGRYQVDDRH